MKNICRFGASLLVVLFLCLAGYIQGANLGAGTVAAVVDGHSITYGEIHGNPELIKLVSGDSFEGDALKEAVQEDELRNLGREIRRIIFETQIEAMGITAEEQEINERVEEIFEKSHMTREQSQKVVATLQAVYAALVEWQNDPSLGDAIYEQKLATIEISPEQWKLYQMSYDTPEKLERFIVPKGLDDMKANSRKSSARDVLQAKLNDIITKDVNITDERVRTEYAVRYAGVLPKPSFQEVKADVYFSLLTTAQNEAIRVWWSKQYTRSITMLHENFRPVLTILGERDKGSGSDADIPSTFETLQRNSLPQQQGSCKGNDTKVILPIALITGLLGGLLLLRRFVR